MSTLRNKAHKIFQQPPCEENRFFSFDDDLGYVTQFAPPWAPNADLEEMRKPFAAYDKAIKDEFGSDHFLGEEGMPLPIGMRMGLGWC